jgi:microcystin-dependent protein
LGQKTGAEVVTMSVAQLPSHNHSVPLGFQTGFSGGDQPQPVLKPSLVLQYLIATNGEIPSLSGQATNKMIGEIQLFAGSIVPGGWAPCNGQSLSVAAYPGLFGVISNFYGGDGVASFALPNLLSRVPVGTIDGHPGAMYGSEQATLTLAQMPVHTHTVPAPDFDRWTIGYGLSGATAAFDADPDGDGVPNGFEWATGTNPTNASSFAALKINSAADFVNIQFPRNTNATDVTCSLDRTTDLSVASVWSGLVTNLGGIWNPSAMVFETGVTNPVNVNVADPRGNRPAADYRLKLQWP